MRAPEVHRNFWSVLPPQYKLHAIGGSDRSVVPIYGNTYTPSASVGVDWRDSITFWSKIWERMGWAISLFFHIHSKLECKLEDKIAAVGLSRWVAVDQPPKSTLKGRWETLIFYYCERSNNVCRRCRGPGSVQEHLQAGQSLIDLNLNSTLRLKNFRHH